jgi:hypothetical protein
VVTEWDKRLDDLMRIGLGLTPPFDILRPIEGLSGLVTQAEAEGFAAVWAPSLPSVGPPDALVLLGALGPATSRIELEAATWFRRSLDIRPCLPSRRSPFSSSAPFGSHSASASATSRSSKALKHDDPITE